ncbi:MAG: fasciclin domain-containing protein [Wenzhouxiangella sp.]
MTTRITTAISGLLLALVLSPATADYSNRNLIDTAREAGQFSTLLTAIDAAGLTDALSGPGPFTVFAPTDEAFAAIPADQLNAILADTATLTSILTYHVVSGRVSSAEVAGLDSAETLQGSSVSIEAGPNGVTIDGANITAVDIETSNGIIHVIDAVITP